MYPIYQTYIVHAIYVPIHFCELKKYKNEISFVDLSITSMFLHHMQQQNKMQ